MFSVRNIAARQLFAKNTYSLGFGKKRKPTPNDLQKYDVVVIGAGLGSVLATHLDAIEGQKAKIFLTYDNPVTYFTAERKLYQAGVITKFNFGSPTRQLISKNIAQSDYMGVEKINANNNQVVLRNGKIVKYQNLVIALGQKDNYSQIKGFDDAWADPIHPFYTNLDHASWKSNVSKTYRVHLNFNGGDALFYIPPNNFHGELHDYNFFVSKAIWDLHVKTGKLSWQSSKLTVINPNSSFSKYFPKADDFIKSTCHDRNINIENDLVLVEVKKDQNTAVFKRQSNGQLVERQYGHLYSLMPTTPYSLVAQSGLADSTGFLDVDPHTLQSKKYENIFGVGDVNNVPTTKSFYGGLSQVHVVRHNIIRRLNGLPLNAKYDGYSKTQLSTSASNLVNIQHNYDGQQVSFTADGLSSSLNKTVYSMFSKHGQENIFKFKNWGPPYYKFKKSFDNNSGIQVPEKKAA